MKRNLVIDLIAWVWERNGGQVNGKTIGGLAIIAGLVVLGFIAYRFMMMDMIMKLANH